MAHDSTPSVSAEVPLAPDELIKRHSEILLPSGFEEDSIFCLSRCIADFEDVPRDNRRPGHQKLLALRIEIQTRLQATTASAVAAVSELNKRVADAKQNRNAFSSWRVETESHVRGQLEFIAAGVEDSLNSSIEPSVNGYLVRQVFRKHPVQHMTPPEIRLAAAKLHRTALALSQQAADPHLNSFFDGVATLLLALPSDIRHQASLNSVVAFTPFFQAVPLEEKPKDATEVRNLIIGGVFGSSVASLSQTLLAVKLAAFPVIGLMAGSLLLSKADWNCRERDRIAGQISFRISETIGRFRTQIIKHLRKLKAEVLVCAQRELQAAEGRRHRQCDDTIAHLIEQVLEAEHRRDVEQASLRREIEAVDRIIQFACNREALP